MMHVSTVSPALRGSLRDRILRALRRYWPLYLMAIPGMLYFIIYKIVPIFGAVIAFKNFTIKKGIWGSPWAQPWYQHYKYFFRSPSNVRIITNTITLSLGKLVVGLLPPLIFALAISECRNKYVARAIQTVSYLPHFLSWAVVYGICLTMLSESTGVINGLIKFLRRQNHPLPYQQQILSRRIDWFRPVEKPGLGRHHLHRGHHGRGYYAV